MEDVMSESHNPAEERESAVDEALEETFPASDPPANGVQTGTRLIPSQPGRAADAATAERGGPEESLHNKG
jgi:hypothetical protein